MSKCRAKNPASCRYHGSSNPVAALVNDKIASDNLRESKKAQDMASNVEEFFEASQNVGHDSTVYDATLTGLGALKRSLGYQPAGQAISPDERLALRHRLYEAESYRDEVMSNDPAHQETVNNYNNFVEKNAVAVYDMSPSAYVKSGHALQDLPYGTPIAVKLEHGYLYTRAGDGFNKRPSSVAKALRFSIPKFVQIWKSDPGPDTISVQSSRMLIGTGNVKEIAVLKDDAYDNGFGELVNSHVGKESFDGRAPHVESSRWSLEGDDYYYEFEGYNGTDITNVSRKMDFWSSGRQMSFEPSSTPTVREIKSTA